ncbi:MAG: VCBS repeat-containing protein, partial [Deltaproteobacteria bacterium]|nr:VCBS repeat-containing protein [Deltaproteobacteria bacterium]
MTNASGRLASLVVFLSSLVAPLVHAGEPRSRHADVWPFGSGCRITWNADASALTFGTDPVMATFEGCAAFSDPQSGELLIYTDGIRVWNAAGVQKNVGANLPGDPSSLHSGVIVPVPGSPGKVYVFGHGATASNGISWQRYDLTNGVGYDNVSGSVTFGGSAGREGMFVLPHTNGVDYWLVVSGVSSIYVIPITSTGVGAHTTTASGLSVWNNGWHVFAASHQGDRIIMSGNSSTGTDAAGDMASWDFDRSTGTLSNRKLINAGFRRSEYYGGVFSPSGKRFYFSTLTENGTQSAFYQYDLEAEAFYELSRQSPRYTHGDGRLAPDGKIYIAGDASNKVHVVANPDAACGPTSSNACGFQFGALTPPVGCTVELGLPQAPSPTITVQLSLSVNLDVPAVVTTSTLTPSGSANAPNGATVTVTATAPDGTTRTCEATVQGAAWACAAGAITNVTPGSWVVVAVLSYQGTYADDQEVFCAATSAETAPTTCFEVCGDLVDNDHDGYVDAYDAACQPGALSCTVPVTPGAFTIRESRSTTQDYEDLFWPVTGDVDGDGKTEILAANKTRGVIEVLDGKTLAVKSSIPVDGNRGDNFTLANLDADPELEVITLVHTVGRMTVADFKNGQWVVNISAANETAYYCGGNVGSGLGLSVADFDGDGKAEIYYGNEIWTYPADLSTGCTGCVTKILDADRDVVGTAKHGCFLQASAGNPQGTVSVAADVLSRADCAGSAECDGPELIVAGQVFSVDVKNRTMNLRRDVDTFGSGTGFGDGYNAVADLDQDGDLDVVVHATAPGGNLFAYDPKNKKVLRIWNFAEPGFHSYSPLTIADVWDEDLADDGNTANGSKTNLPDIVFTRQYRLYAVNVASANALWSLTTTDNSGATSTSVFDFNGDGILELAYRDQDTMRVMYGGPIAYAPQGVDTQSRNYASFACTSATMNEGPTIADVDDDGAADLTVVCGSSAPAKLVVFTSNSTPWREARHLWNQALFRPGAIDDLGRVYPVAQAPNAFIPEGAAGRPLNVALAQVSPLDLRPHGGDRVAAIDARISGVTVTAASQCFGPATEVAVDFTLTNAGDASIPTFLPVSFYGASPETVGPSATLVLADMAVLSGQVPLAKGASARLRATLSIGSVSTLWVAVNETGDGPAVAECDAGNNLSGEVACVEGGCDLGDASVPAEGCEAEAPYCAVVAGVKACVPCVDDSAGGLDSGCSAEAPSCDPIVRSCGPCEGDPVCAAAGVCDDGQAPGLSFPVELNCAVEAEVGLVDPTVEWRNGAFTYQPGYAQVMMQPVVGNLTDDNGDGVIDARDVPDIVFTTFTSSAYASAGVLRVISGDDGRELFGTLGTTEAAYPYGAGGVALGDLDGNGRPEIVAGVTAASGATVAVWEANVPGQTPAFVFKWKSNACGLAANPYTHPAIANVDGVGAAEIIVPGPCVLNADGTLRAVAAAPYANRLMPFAADLDADPELEIIDGGTVYDLPTSGTTLLLTHQVVGSTGYVFGAVGDLDGDGEPELVVVDNQNAQVRVWDPNGAIDADSIDDWTLGIDLTGTGARGGPPTLADFDGDGQVEIGVAAMYTYLVIDTAGTLLWSAPVVDASSRVTGSAVFDFDGDGSAEVVYADEENLWVYDGKTGDVRTQITEHASGTLFEYPIVADVDRDGRAEIVLASNNYGRAGWTGITVLGSATNSWSPARPVWNQHAYNISNVGDDLSIPPVPVKNWTRWNNFRAGAPVEGLANWRSDLFVADWEFCEAGCDEGPFGILTIVIGNRGRLDVSDAEVRLLMGSVEGFEAGIASGVRVPSGGSGVATFEIGPWAFDEGELVIEVRSRDEIPECVLSNNFGSLPHAPIFTDLDQDQIADVCDACVATGTEVCDGLDNDCNGRTDDGCDDDGDGYCDAALG